MILHREQRMRFPFRLVKIEVKETQVVFVFICLIGMEIINIKSNDKMNCVEHRYNCVKS